MTFPRRPGVPGAGFTLEEPSDLLRVNRAILQELRSQGGLRRGIGGEATRGGTDEGILGQVDTGAGALTNVRVPIPNLKEIYIADWPFELTSLQVRLNSPDSPAIEVLRFGRRITSRFPIKEIYITTPQVISGQIVILAGGVGVSDVPWSLLNPLSFEQRRKHTRIQSQASFVATLTLPTLNQPGLFHVQRLSNAVGNTVMIDNIPANHRCRVYGWVGADLSGVSPNFGGFDVNWSSAAGAVRNRLMRVRGGEVQTHWPFDVEYFIDRVEAEIAFDVTSLQPPGNRFGLSLWLEIHPL